MKRVGIYCGSFNPVHKGHIRIAKACLAQHLVDEVRIIATGAYWQKNDLYPFEDRIRMLKMVAEEGIVIDETHNEMPYTYMIFRALQEEEPENEYFLILGADNLPRFSEWKNYEELLKHGFIVLPRDEIDRTQIAKLMDDLHKTNYRILRLKPIDISSTYIREHLDDYGLVRDMVDKNVYRYLKQMKGNDHAA